MLEINYKNMIFTLIFLGCVLGYSSKNVFGFDVGFTTSLNKVFFEEPKDFKGTIADETLIELAKNEYEATQMVIFPTENLNNVTVEVSDLTRVGSSEIIPKGEISIDVIGYVNQVEAKVSGDRIGWIPDPLLPNQALNLTSNVIQPYLITVHTAETTIEGDYKGEILIKTGGVAQKTLALKVKVWNFTLPKVSTFKTTSLTSWYTISGMWPESQGYPWLERDQRKQYFLKLADLGFKNKLPPVAYLANGFDCTGYGYPTHDSTTFNAARTGELIDYMINKGANHFFIAFLCGDIYQNTTNENTLKQYLTDYRTYLSSRGLLDKAYVYNLDEPWGGDVDVAKYLYSFIKNSVATDIKVLQNTNQDNGSIIGSFLGFFDALDINLGWFDVTNASNYRTQNPDKLKDFWWNVNIWPDSHPNIFLEYPLMDARIIGPMSYKYKMQGFELWDLFTGGWSIGNYHTVASNELRVNWDVNLRSLDGNLVYPGQNYEIYSSLRYESFRDGIEDMDYLYLLEKEDPTNTLLNVGIVSGLTSFTNDASAYLDFRREVALILSKPGDANSADDNQNNQANADASLSDSKYSVSGGCSIDNGTRASNKLFYFLLILFSVEIIRSFRRSIL